jgi:hypothetical protein
MNEFTKDELIILKNGIEYLPNNVNLSQQYMFDCGVVLSKLYTMIKNYDSLDAIKKQTIKHGGNFL